MELSEIKKDVMEHKLKYSLLCIAVAALFMIVIWLKSFIFIVSIIIINILMSRFLRTLKRNHIGIELVMFSTVLSGAIYGAKIGMIVGGISMLLDYVSSARLSYFSMVTIPSYVAIGGLAALFYNMGYGITMIGIGLTLAYNIITNFIIIGGLLGGHLDKCLRFSATNLVFNALLFWHIAPFFARMLT